jgi:hypothetical protein
MGGTEYDYSIECYLTYASGLGMNVLKPTATRLGSHFPLSLLYFTSRLDKGHRLVVIIFDMKCDGGDGGKDPKNRLFLHWPVETHGHPGSSVKSIPDTA